MFSFLKKIFRSNPPVNYQDLLDKGAQLLDVRTPEEFRQGHLQGARNIPLASIGENLSKIRKDKPVILYCASGMRSAAARKVLLRKGYEQVYNGGGMQHLKKLLGI